MNVILRSDVDGLGREGDVVDVSDGYARNFLLPHGKAQKATDGAIRQAEVARRARDQRDAKLRSEGDAIASKLVPQIISVVANAGPEGQLYGSVTTADVVEAVEAQTGVELDRRHLHVDDPIREVGAHEVQAKLPAGVQFVIRLDVTAAATE